MTTHKKWAIVFGIGVLSLIILLCTQYFPSVIEIQFKESDISNIVVESIKGERRKTSSNSDKKFFTENLESINARKSGLGLGRKGYMYFLQITDRNGKRKKYLVRSKKYIQYHGFNYEISEESGELLIEKCKSLLEGGLK